MNTEWMEGIGKHFRPRAARKYLYLVLDDCFPGFNIYKIDPDSWESDVDQRCMVGFCHLPEPSTLRINAPVHGIGGMFLAAWGSKIFISPGDGSMDLEVCNEAPTFIYDTEKTVLSVGPPLPVHLLGPTPYCVAVAVGEMLYALSYNRGNHFFEVMSPTGRSWKSLPLPPFGPQECVIAYAVHPDERTIFMTTHNLISGHEKSAYSFDTKACAWSCHGEECLLPFKGQGFFDSELGALVGLLPDGYICACSCDVASCSTASPKLLHPDWVKSKRKLFRKDHDNDSAATLTYMGRNKFCLVQSVRREGFDFDEEYDVLDRDTHFLRLTMFSLKYNKNKGKLKAALQRPTHTYVVCRFTNLFPLGAFWM